MMVYIDKADEGDLIVLLAVAESEDAIGDMVREVRPREVVFGKTYEEWASAESPLEVN